MMISANGYIQSKINKSYEELLEEREKLLKRITDFENSCGDKSDVIISPSPSVMYQCNLLYLAKLCELIAEKYRIKESDVNKNNV
jgi:hypothetical protein